jgi:hypothetical protein
MHPEHTSIGELAYRLWQARGCPEGSAERDWLDAEKQLRSAQPRVTEAASAQAIDASLKETFPASDPPASRLPDEPPANADAKWKAAGVSRTAPAARPRQAKSGQSKPNAKASGQGAKPSEPSAKPPG